MPGPPSPPGDRGRRSRAEAWLGTLALLFAAALPLSIAVAEAALALLAVAWLAARRPGPRSPLAWPALAYTALTLLSAAASDRPAASLADAKEVLLFSILLVLPPAVAAAERIAGFFLLGAGASAVWGVSHYLATPGGLAYRDRGPYGHYMTWSGVLMLAAILALAGLLARGGRRSAPAHALLLGVLALALAVSYSRNAWLGLLAGAVVVGLLLRPWAVLGVALAALVAGRIAPAELRQRAASIADLEGNQDRLEMLRFGTTLIRQHPWLGVGPNRIPAAYARRPDLRPQPHLHSNPVQIAAERGVPALLAWLWLLGAAALAVWRRRAAAPRSAAPAAGLGAIAALLVAGLFEYNFGDSEVKMAFLLLLVIALHQPLLATAPREPPQRRPGADPA